MMKRFLLASIVLLAVSGQSFGDLSMVSLNYNENFDAAGAITGTFTSTIGAQVSIGNSGWVGTKIAGTGTASTSVTVDNGAGGSGAIYSFGATGDTERALGTNASGTNVMGYGFKLVNNSTSIFQDLTVSFVQENWRSSTSVVNTISASFATSANAADTTFLTAGTFTNATLLDLVGPAPVASNGPLDGNLALNQAPRTFTLSAINLAIGDSLYFRWRDTNDAGNDAGLAIDSFSINATAAAVPEPTSMALVGLAGVAGLVTRARRKSNIAIAA